MDKTGCSSSCTFLLSLSLIWPFSCNEGPFLSIPSAWPMRLDTDLKYLLGPRNLLFFPFSLHISKTSSELFISLHTLVINPFAGGPADSYYYYSPLLSFWTLTERHKQAGNFHVSVSETMSSKIPTRQRVQKCEPCLLPAWAFCCGCRKPQVNEEFLKMGGSEVTLSLEVSSFLPQTKDIYKTFPTT